jgi:hypothetical protein
VVLIGGNTVSQSNLINILSRRERLGHSQHRKIRRFPILYPSFRRGSKADASRIEPSTLGDMPLAGVGLRTVQQWLGHSDMESTMRYLKPSRSQKVREKVNEIFA